MSNSMIACCFVSLKRRHPEDPLLIYRRRIEPLIEPVTNGNYDAPIRLIAKVGELLKRMDREKEFRDYVSTCAPPTSGNVT